HNDGWRMRASKAGRKGGTTQTLADLKRLRKEAEAAAHRAAAEASKKETARREASARGEFPVRASRSVSAISPSPVLDEQDRILFRRAVKSVQAIKDTRRAILPPVAHA